MLGDLLVGWKDLQRMQIISPNFPKVPGSKKTTEIEEQEANFAIRKAEVEKENQREKGKKFKKLNADVLIKEYKDVFL
jgi:hypothetical protein